MKNLFALIFAFAMVLSLSGCGWEVEIVDPSEQISELEKPETEKPSAENTVTEEFVEEIVLNFGAEKTEDGKIRAKGDFSFYFSNGEYRNFHDFGPDDDVLYGIGNMLGEEAREEALINGSGYNALPGEVFEKTALEYFGISAEPLRGSIHYLEDGGKGWYYPFGAVYITEYPEIVIESYQDDGELLNIFIKVDYSEKEDLFRILNVRFLPEGGYNYLSYIEDETKEQEIPEQNSEEPPFVGTENEFGIEAEKIEYAMKLIENYEEVKSDEKFVYRGEDGKIVTAPLEKFIESVENNESGSVFGVLAGEPTLYYFELYFEPNGLIDFIRISPFDVFAAEFSEVYDNEIFCYFTDGEETSFSVRKTERFADEKTEHSPEEDIPGMPVTIEAAKEKVKAVLLSENGMSGYGERFGTEAALIREDYSANADEYVKSLEPKCKGIYEIGGKLYYKFYFFSGENSAGIGYYVCSENIELVLGISEMDGGLVPVAYLANPRITIEK